MDTTLYEQYRSGMRTGDAIFFRGTGLISRIIQWTTRSHFSHVAMVIRRTAQLDSLGYRILVLQATHKYGVNSPPLSRVLSAHKGQAWWCQIDHPRMQQQWPNYQALLEDWADSQEGRDYDLPGALAVRLPFFRERTGMAFCSELYAQAFKENFGLLDLPKPAPSDLVHDLLLAVHPLVSLI